MTAKVLLLLALVAATAADRPSYGYEDSYESYESEEPKYEYSYKVKDYYGNDFGHNENRDGDHTEGSYYNHLPDGRLQKVKYYVDGYSGYVADVSYEGEAHYDSGSYESGEHYRPRYGSGPRKYGGSSFSFGSRGSDESRFNSVSRESRESDESSFSFGSRGSDESRFNSVSRESRESDESSFSFGSRGSDESRFNSGSRESVEFYRPLYVSRSRESGESRFGFGSRGSDESRFNSGSREFRESGESRLRFGSRRFGESRTSTVSGQRSGVPILDGYRPQLLYSPTLNAAK